MSLQLGTSQGASVNQTEKCPFCASKIEAEAERCQFCGSDLGDSVSSTQEDAQPKKTVGRTVLYFMGIVVSATLMFYLEGFLPEDVRQWLDWLDGKGKPYKPMWIIILAPILFCVVTGWTITLAKKRRGLKVMDKEKQRNAD